MTLPRDQFFKMSEMYMQKKNYFSYSSSFFFLNESNKHCHAPSNHAHVVHSRAINK